MIIIGLDPALVSTGVAVVKVGENNAAEVLCTEEVKTCSRQDLSQRLFSIYERVKVHIEKYAPDVMVLEKLYSHHRHPATLKMLAQVKGVVALLAYQNNIDFYEFSTK